ncbi:hypothetical protein FACS1894168_3260 [Deltaproteobacteria bacterium]|nr:hypothetical protein FACS1894168_3260 [Deltaproteobacteria bacterium]
MQTRNPFLLPALSMGLIYGSISFGMIVLNLRGSSKSSGEFAALLHFVLTLLVGLGMVLVAKKTRDHPALPRLFAALTALAGLLCAIVPLLPGDWPLRLLQGNPPVFATITALFLPLGLTLFFRAAPAGREGFFYSLVMTAGELLWVLLFPLLSYAPPVAGELAADGRVFHLFTLYCLIIGGTGLCLSAAFYRHGVPQRPRNAAPQLFPGQRALLLRMFSAGAGIFILMGLEMGMGLPKATIAPGFIALPHILPLFFLLPAGWMLDSDKPGRLMIALMPVCLLAPLLGLASFEPLALFCLLAALRQILLLAVFTACARLMKNHALLPLLLAVAHCLYLTQLGGVFLRAQLAASPRGVFAAALVLAAATAFCLWRFRLLTAKNPELWVLPALPADSADEAAAKFHAFAVAHNLSGREQELLAGMIRGASLEDMGQELRVTLRTARFHLTGLLKKTNTRSQRNVSEYYAFWKP